jgi:hypothetical protein
MNLLLFYRNRISFHSEPNVVILTTPSSPNILFSVFHRVKDSVFREFREWKRMSRSNRNIAGCPYHLRPLPGTFTGSKKQKTMETLDHDPAGPLMKLVA